jgi:hypothetical protein
VSGSDVDGDRQGVPVLPTHKAVRQLVHDVTGRSVTVAPAAPLAPGAGDHATLAVYVDQHLRTEAVALCDLDLAVYVGAAARTIPVGGTEAERASRCLTERTASAVRTLFEQLAELMAPLEGAAPLLHGVYPAGEEAPSDVVAYACALGRRVDLEVTVSAYGSGRLSVVLPANVS